MFGIGGNELAIILVFGFLLFGPDKLPQMGRTIGRALRQFNETRDKMTSVVQSEVIDPMAAAAQAPAKPKKSGVTPTGATVDDDDLDADIADDAIASAPRRKETFAERRARLAAERAEKEKAAEKASQAEGDSPASASDADTAQAGKPAEAPEPAPAPEVRTTADLYARRPRKVKAASPADDASKGGER